MPRLPGPEEIYGTSLPPLDVPNRFARIDTSSIGRGITDLGRAISGVASALKTGWERSRRSDAQAKYLQHQADEKRRIDEFKATLPPTDEAEGAAKKHMDGVEERKEKFLSSLPPEVQPEYRQKLSDNSDAIYLQGARAEAGALARHVRNSVDQTVQNVLVPKAAEAGLAGDRSSLDRVLSEAGDLVVGSALPEFQKPITHEVARASLMTAYDAAGADQVKAEMNQDQALSSGPDLLKVTLPPHQRTLRSYVAGANKPSTIADGTEIALHDESLKAFDRFVEANPDASPKTLQEFTNEVVNSERESVKAQKMATLPLPQALAGISRGSMSKEYVDAAKMDVASALKEGRITLEDAAQQANILRQWNSAFG